MNDDGEQLSMKCILLEDERVTSILLKDSLNDVGICCDVAHTLDDARALLDTYAYDLAILDRGLPDGDGLSVLQELRDRKATIPVMFLTASNESADVIRCLDAGADDYVTKPCDNSELLARVRALLRRPQVVPDTVLTQANLCFNTVSRTAMVDRCPLRLSPKELTLLEMLMRRLGKIVTRGTLEEGLYNCEVEFTGNSIEACVSRLRKSLNATKSEVEVQTVRGVGYLLTKAGTARPS